MTVQTNTNVASFNGNGVTQIFPIAFKFNNDTDLIVMLADDATGSSSLLTLNSDYTVSGEGDEEGGLINVVVAPAVGKRLFVSRVVDILQMTDLRNQGKFFAEVHEDAFDLLTMIAQQHKSDIARSLRVAETDPEPARIPPAVQRAGKLLAFDSAGNPTTALPVADSSTELRQEIVSGSLLTASMVSGVSRNIADVATLRATAGRFDGEAINLLAYGAGYSNGGGGGLLYWDAASTVADDGGITFAVSGVLTGRWVRRVERFVDAAWYGLPLASGSCITQDAAIEAYCFANKVSAWYGPGIYDFGENNWSWSGPRIAGQPLKDYEGVRIYSCPEAIFRTTSVGGADVMQCCGIKNFGVIGYPTVTAILNNVDDTLSGSNALSLVFGAVDCVFELTVKDMPGIYKSTGAIDGGQGFSIQPGTGNTNPYSNVILRGSVDGATQGFGCDFELDNQVDYPLMGIRLDLDIANCYRGVAIAGAAATVAGAAYTGITGSVRVRNCQQSYLNFRSLGTALDVEVVNTLPKESLVKHAYNPDVIVTNILAAKDGAARIYGRVLTVDTLLNVGGTQMGGGQFGSTSEFTLEHAVTFTGATNQVIVADSGGNAVDKCRVSLTHVTAGYAALSTKGSNTVTINGASISPVVYPGDTSITAVAGPTFKAVYDAPLTAVRAVFFASAPRAGDTVRVVRLAAATGGGVSVGGLMNILAGTWADATYSGSAWAITGQGSV